MEVSDWIQLAVGIVLFLTLIAVVWYANEARTMAKATVQLAEESQRQRQALWEPWIQPYVRKGPEMPFAGWEVTYSNTGQGDAYQVERLIVLNTDAASCRQSWEEGEHPSNATQVTTTSPWPHIPAGSSQTWSLDSLGGADSYMAVAVYKDRFRRSFVAGYGFRREGDGMRPTEAIAPMLLGGNEHPTPS